MPLKLLELDKINKQKVGFFRYKELNNNYLITNEIGEYCFLTPRQFNSFLSGTTELDHPRVYQELLNKSFILNNLDLDNLSNRYASKNDFLLNSTSLHIIVVTLRCDHNCLYCQTSSSTLKNKKLDMDIGTAKLVVDRIFESFNPRIDIEFQGGEPLVNWDTLRFIIEYAKKKNKSAKKKLFFYLVSNFTFMTQERLKFLINNKVHLCTSLDGPEIIHNRNRVSRGDKNSYRNTIKWLRIIKKEIRRNKNYKYHTNALTTVTKLSLSHAKEIVDEYVNLGLEGIFLRPVSPFGLSKKRRREVEFSYEDFFDFYREALDYIIEINLKGKKFLEKTAQIFLIKILLNKDPNFFDIRSPCGAGIGQLAYNFNGNVYTCDEGRMMSAIGDESFCVGNVRENIYEEFINNETIKTMCLASCLDNIPMCNECVYMPYCGVCPIYNYVVEGNIFSCVNHNKRCKIQSKILDYIFIKLENEKNRRVFLKWIDSK